MFAPKPVYDCFHVFSDGTRLTVLYDTDEDYIFMMNKIPIVAYYCNLKVLALEVMRTHFHAVVRGTPENVEKFRRELKRLIVRQYNRDGRSDMVKNTIDIVAEPIKDDEQLRRAIIYVFRNCTEAGYPFLPEDYPWGAGRVYCHDDSAVYPKVSKLGYRECCRFFKTRVKLPQDWEFDAKGMLVPRSYMDRKYLREHVFVSPRQFIAFLNVKKRDLADMEAANARPFLEKQDERKLLEQMQSYSANSFGKPLGSLTQAQRIMLATHFWNERKTLSIKQLARLSKVDGEVLRAILHIPKKE